MTNHRGDPFAGVDGPMEQHGRLGTLPATSPDVDSREIPALDRRPRRDELRVLGVGRLQVAQKLQVIRVAMVRRKPALARHYRY